MGFLKRLRTLLRDSGRRVRRWFRPPDYRRLVRRVESLEVNLEHLLHARHADLVLADDDRGALRSHECKVHSQNGEDGLLLHLFSQIGVKSRRTVEFGIGDGHECNSANLILNFGWGGLLMDLQEESVAEAKRFYHEQGGVAQERLRIACERIDAHNVNEVLLRHGASGEVDLLSVDIDSNDYWVWKAIEIVQPRVVVVEYNASLGPTESWITRYDPAFNPKAHHPQGWYHGASLAAFHALGERRGFALVGCDSNGVNAFFVRRDLAEGRLPILVPEDAWYPHRRRLRHATPQEQRASLMGLPYTPD